MSDVNISIEQDKEVSIAIQDSSPINLEVLEKGATGQRGLPGVDGKDGENATVAVGSTQTVPYGEDAQVTNSGTPSNVILDFSIPEGKQGEQGIPGEPGKDGEPGEQGDPGIVDPTSLKNATLIEDTTNTDDYEGEIDIDNYFVGLKVNLKVTNANTGASSLNVGSLGAKAIKKNVIDDLEADDIKAGQILPLIYDGTNFQIVGGGGSATPTWTELSFSATPIIDMDNGVKQFITLAGDVEFSMENVVDARVFMIKIIQDGVGNHAVTWDSGLNITWLTSSHTVGGSANSITVFGFIKTGASAYDGYLMGNT